APTPAAGPDHVAPVAQHRGCVPVETQDASASTPQLHNSLKELELLLHVPTDVGPENELYGSAGWQGLLQQPPVLNEVFEVLGESYLVAIPGKAFGAVFVIRESLKIRRGTRFLAK